MVGSSYIPTIPPLLKVPLVGLRNSDLRQQVLIFISFRGRHRGAPGPLTFVDLETGRRFELALCLQQQSFTTSKTDLIFGGNSIIGIPSSE